MNPTCPFCNATISPRARFCSTCGKPLPAVFFPLAPPEERAVPAASPSASAPVAAPAPAPVEAAISTRRLRVEGDELQLRDVINVVESGVHWWRERLASADAVTRAQAAQSIAELSKILQSLAEQLALGRETVRITTRLPALRAYELGCPICGRGNRAGARYCQGCGTPLAPTAQPSTRGGAMALRITVAAHSDQGRVRRNNEDSVYAGQLQLADGRTAHLCLVADGMGGAAAGEHASRIASEVTQTYLQRGVDGQATPDDAAWETLLRAAARDANQRIYAEARANKEQRGMGTTLTVALIVADRVHIAQVGDSRAYLLNAGGVTQDGATSAQLTSDHSLVARLVDIGQITSEEARAHPQRNLLYRSLGTDPAVEVDTRSDQLEPGDLLLLCSDGLVNYVRDEEIAQIVLANEPERACERLIALANERGGGDNISVVVVRVESA